MTLPARIGRYRVLGLVGQGAMGTVYRGRDEALERDVALKVMSAGHGADADSRARFQREAKAAGRLRHPNIVTIYELGEHEGNPFMALELLEGVDLQRAIEGGLRPDPKVTLPIVLQLLTGLGHAHEHGIVHRDVKPSNVFLPRGRPVKIMDFGVARLAGGMTTAGMVVGTPNYMSPEQVRTGPLDGRSDLFSAGLILYELVTGEKAYRGDTVVALLYKIVHEDPDLGLIPREPQWERLGQVLARSLARDPDDRYPDARAMADDLEQALLDLGGSANWAAASDAGMMVRTPAPMPIAIPETLPPTAATAPAPAPVAAPAERRPILIAAALGVASAVILGFAVYVARGTAKGGAPVGAQMTAPASLAPTNVPASPAATARARPASAPTTLAAPPTATPPPPRPSPDAATSTPTAATRPAPAPAEADASPPEPAPENAQLARAEQMFEQRRYAAALAEARALLKRDPRNAKAKELAEDAEVEVVVENRLREAGAALKRGDKDAAQEILKAGLAVKPTDSRLIELWREATRE